MGKSQSADVGERDSSERVPKEKSADQKTGNGLKEIARAGKHTHAGILARLRGAGWVAKDESISSFIVSSLLRPAAGKPAKGQSHPTVDAHSFPAESLENLENAESGHITSMTGIVFQQLKVAFRF
jgi:hypothetical protein